jgi:autotransporter-associated beta strand protein
MRDRFAHRSVACWFRRLRRGLPPLTPTTRRAAFIGVAALIAVAATPSARAQNATWLAAPGSGDFDTGANWTPATVPTGVASFGVSNVTALSFSTNTTIGGWTFNAGASNYTFTVGPSRVLAFTGAGIVINGGAATIINDSSLTFDNASTAGAATISNGGTLVFTNASSAGTATITNTGYAAIADTATAADAKITNTFFFGFYDTGSAGNAVITNNGDMYFYDSSSAANANIATNRLLSFNNNSSAGNASIVNTLQVTFNNDSTAGNSTIVTQSGGYTSFFDNSNGGEAQFVAAAGGVVDFSASSGPAGNHVFTAGSIAGAGNFYLGANDLVVGGNNLSTTVSGVISDCGSIGAACLGAPAAFGSLTKVGSGALTLTGANTYTGATTIDSGTLEVDGSIASSSLTTVMSGATLTGVGSVGATQVNSGGVFAPGSGMPGTSMTIYGSLAFNSGATYEVYLNPSTSTLAKVMGPASLNGEVLADFAPGSYVTKQYTILTASGGLGGTTFASLATVGAPAGFAETLTYDADDVYLDLTSTLGATPGLNVNQRNVAAALGNAFNNGASLPPAFANVFGLTGAALPSALTQLSGEAADGARQGAFLLDDMFLTLMLDPYAENRGADLSGAGSFGAGLGYANDEPQPSAFSALAKGPAQAAPYLPRWNAWGAAFGGGASISGVASIGSHDTSSAAGGFAAGADYHVAADAMLGFAVAGSGAGWSLSQGLGGGRSDVFQVGVYAVHDFGPAYVAAALDASNYWTTTNRTVALPGGGAYAANFEAQSFGARLESGYRIPLTAFTLTPYAALQAIAFQAPAYAESAGTGGPGFALNYAAQSAEDTRLELGAWADKTFALADGDALKLFGRAAYVHDWQNNPAMTATFEGLPTAFFVVNGAKPAPSQGLVAVGAEWRFAKNWTLMAKFQGEFGSGTQSYNAAARLSYVW